MWYAFKMDERLVEEAKTKKELLSKLPTENIKCKKIKNGYELKSFGNEVRRETYYFYNGKNNALNDGWEFDS